MLGFKGFASAVITIAGIELLHRLRKGQFKLVPLHRGFDGLLVVGAQGR
jgi:hypothetical protein